MSLELSELYKRWSLDPVVFSAEALGFVPTDQQRSLLEGVKSHKYVACRSGHGTGKSTALAALIWWYLICFNGSQVPCTAPTSDQLRNVLWSRLRGFYEALPKYLKKQWHITVDRVEEVDGESFAVARTSRLDNPDALQGFHARNLLVVADEASGIPNQVFMPILGALTGRNNRIVLIGNPTRNAGFFYGSFSKGSYWHKLVFNAESSPIVERDQVEFWRERYGEDSNEYRIRVLGEFPRQGSMSLFNENTIRRAFEAELFEGSPVVWGVDVARYGDDETVIAKRHGNVIKEIKRTQSLSTVEVAKMVKREYLFTQELYRPQVIFVDSVGIGAGVLDRLREDFLPARGVNGGSKAMMHEIYSNLRAEMFCSLKDKLESCEVRLPVMTELMDQLLGIEYTFDNRGRYKLVSKESLKRRGLKSPDLADAIALTFSEVVLSRENVVEYGETYSTTYNVFA